MTGPATVNSSPGAYGKIFVVGCPRSGTTWIGDIFRAHPGAVLSMESALLDCLRQPWWEIGRVGLDPEPPPPGLSDRLLDGIEPLLVRLPPGIRAEWRKTFIDYFGNRAAWIFHHAHLFPAVTVQAQIRRPVVRYRRLLQHLAAVEAEAAGQPHEEKVACLARRIFDEFFQKWGGTPERVFVEKTPSHLFHARFLLDHFPEARLIEVVRDGRDVCVSMDSYKTWMPQDRKFQIWLWTRSVQEGFKLQEDPELAGRVLRVRYEDLKKDRDAETAKLLAFSGLEVTPEILARIAEETRLGRRQKAGEGKHYRKGVVGDWQGRMSPEDLDLFRRAAGRELTRLGYTW